MAAPTGSEGATHLVCLRLLRVCFLEKTPRCLPSPVRGGGRSALWTLILRGIFYQDRYEIFTRRLVRERLYRVACVVTTSRTQSSPWRRSQTKPPPRSYGHGSAGFW